MPQLQGPSHFDDFSTAMWSIFAVTFMQGLHNTILIRCDISYVCVRVYVCVCMCVYDISHTSVCMRAHACASDCKYVNIWIWTCKTYIIRYTLYDIHSTTYKHTHGQAYTHTYTTHDVYTYVRTCTHSCARVY